MVISYSINDEDIKKEYELFREYYFGKTITIFENLAKKAYSILKVRAPKEKEKEFEKLKSEIHINISYSELLSLAYLSFIIFLVFGGILFIILKNFTILIFFAILALLFYSLIIQYPQLLYESLKRKKEGQLIIALMLLAMKLRENPNLEIAFTYAAKHLQPPLKLDFLRLLWDTFNKKYSSLQDAIDVYIKKWEHAEHFVIGMQLLVSALYEPDQIRREMIIDKAVEDSLNVLYDKMSLYVRELQSPINLIYMLGIVLPTLLLTIFPIASVLMGDVFSPSFLFMIFDVAVPFLVFLLIKQFIEAKRIEAISKQDMYLYLYMKQNDIKIKTISIVLGIIVGSIILFGGLHFVTNWLSNFDKISIIIAAIFILSIGTGLAIGYYIYYNFYKEFDKRLDTIEKEISSFLFSLGNVLNENIPIESAIIQIYPRFRKKEIGKFLALVYRNIRLGMSIKDAIFDKRMGALIKFPSSYLEAAMQVLIESAETSPKAAAKSAIAMSRYFIYLQKAKLRLLDLTAEVTSQMKSLAKLLAPAILSIITAVSIMSLVILFKLGIAIENIKSLYSYQASSQLSTYTYLASSLLDLFSFTGKVSPASLYIIIGLFNILITLLIAYMLNIIENGRDKLKEKKYIYSFLFTSVLIFFILSTFASLALWSFAESMMSAVLG